MAHRQITQVGASLPFATLQPWTCCARPSGTIAHPDRLANYDDWLPAEVPGTAAAALEASGQWRLGEQHDFDAEDWWYRTTFAAPSSTCWLRFDGLATLAEIWLNGTKLLTTDNMFRTYEVDITPHLREQNELLLGFRSVADDLKKRRPRPRWKTNLVSQQQLRWLRTTLLGRMPGWTPAVATVGPWRGVHLDTMPIRIDHLQLTTRIDGDDGIVSLSGRMPSTEPILNCRLQVADRETVVTTKADPAGCLLSAHLRVAKPSLWWPHTHGGQPLFPCRILATTADGEFLIDCGKIGFRRLEVRQNDGFTIIVNGVPIYCRGACWTVNDFIRPGAGNSLEHDLRLARAVGANMLRIGGTMVYESDRFYELCDDLGIMVWQDFMFANMDYPVDDPAFAANIEAEAREQLTRLAPHPCLAMLCGNSEVEQQAAMRGVPCELWSNAWFGRRLGELCAEHCPDTGYVPSTPAGGVMPFHVGDGITHYYGVGAYRRPPLELRKADVKFATECLGFANIPEPGTVEVVMEGAVPSVHDPRWKQRVPRDSGAGWDFDDVRDFYLAHLFAVNPVRLRSDDMARYLQLSRVVPGEMMSQVFAEWRSSRGRNQGGLVWFFKDLWPAAGWGIVDSLGVPKASYYYLKRSWQPRQIAITDEGLDGLQLHVINESAEPLMGRVELALLQDGHITVARGAAVCAVQARGRWEIAADALLGGFFDVNYAYRFGPPRHDLVCATLWDEQGRAVSEAFHFVSPREPVFLSDVQLEIAAKQVADGRVEVHLQSNRFLHGVRFDAKGYVPNDDYFHLMPGRVKMVEFTSMDGSELRFRVSVDALNLRGAVMQSVKTGE